MKLISVNIEGAKHLSRIKAFLEKENPDVICLQEAQLNMVMYLRSQGYTVEFLPITLRKEGSVPSVQEGLIVASKYEALFEFFYYHQPGELQEFDKTNTRDTCAQGVVSAEITFEEKKYTIATTHFTWTQNGSIPNFSQVEDMVTFIERISKMPPHIMCGDFNIPRGYNPLYTELLKLYTDNIPPQYKSSLDAALHRFGKDPDKSILFESYMVDYVFTTKPFAVADVRLEFGVSDHAAVVATILPLQT